MVNKLIMGYMLQKKKNIKLLEINDFPFSNGNFMIFYGHTVAQKKHFQTQIDWNRHKL